MAREKEPLKRFVLRIDPETMEALERWAADEFRSTNGQLQWILHEVLRKAGRPGNLQTSADMDSH